MHYHPLIGITIFVTAVILSFFLGRYLIKKNKNNHTENTSIKKNNIPKGEITSPDAPWLKNKE